MSDEKPSLLASTMSLADCLASVRVEQAHFTASGAFVKPGHMAVEGGVLYVHPDAWERVSELLEQLPVKE
jgi:hypothetical protein